jgi:maltose alpha-D-glucosyltransferase/alpha-amylase
MRRLMHMRAQFRAFGRGSFRLLKPENAKIFAFLREYQDETLLIVANLSRFPQCVELDLSEFRGQVPIELFGRVKFPPIGELPYFLTLGAHSFYWFQLRWEAEEEIELSPEQLPICEVESIWPDLLSGRSKDQLESSLQPFLRRDRWFKDGTRRIHRVEMADALPLDAAAEDAVFWILLVNVEFFDHEMVAYQVPVMIADQQTARDLTGDHPSAGILHVKQAGAGSSRTLCDASWERGFWIALFKSVVRKQSISGQRGESFPIHTPEFDHADCHARIDDPADVISLQWKDSANADESSVSAVLSGRFELRLFRHLREGVNPAFELGRILNGQPVHDFVPRVYAAIDYRCENAPIQSLAILSEYRAAECSLWNYTLDELGRALERQQAAHFEEVPEFASPLCRFGKCVESTPPEKIQERFGVYLHLIGQLGRRTAELHTALASETEDSELVAQPLSELYQRSLYQSIRSSFRRSVDSLTRHRSDLQEECQPSAGRVIELQDRLLDGLRRDLGRKLDGQRIRCHGNYELQHVLFTGDDFVITGLAGMAGRPPHETRIKSSPLRDIASMICSLLAASHAALRGDSAGIVIVPDEEEHAECFLRYWFSLCVSFLVHSYSDAIKHAGLVPSDDDGLAKLLRAHLLEQLCWRLGDAIATDANQVSVPLEGMLMLADCYTEEHDERPPEQQT